MTKSAPNMGNKILVGISIAALVVGAVATAWMLTGGRDFIKNAGNGLASSPTAGVIAQQVNCRAEARQGSAVLLQINGYADYPQLGTEDDWTRISVNGLQCWVNNEFIVRDTHIRRGPNEQPRIADYARNQNSVSASSPTTPVSPSSPAYSLIGTWVSDPSDCYGTSFFTTFNDDGTFRGDVDGRWTYDGSYLVMTWESYAGDEINDASEAGAMRTKIEWRGPNEFVRFFDSGPLSQYRCP
jgi:hypothetical protein